MLEDIAKLLFYSLPDDGWDSCVLEYREAGPVSEVVSHITDDDGTDRPVTPPAALIDALEDLRKHMANHGDGVWLSVTLRLAEGRFGYDFNYSARPQWRVPPTADAYVDDLSKYPRPNDQIPAWYPRHPA